MRVLQDLGFVIISPQPSLGGLKNTVRSINNNYPGSSYICVVPQTTRAEEIKEMSDVCKVIKGKQTITSLINAGIKKSEKEWNLIVIEGSVIHKSIGRKFSIFLKDEKDILFPIVIEYDFQGKPRKMHADFVEGTLNGILINQKTFKKVGNFTDNPLEMSKLMWSVQAINEGCCFKGILGAKLC